MPSNIENVLEAYGNNLVGSHIEVSGSGGGGHVIEDAAGNDLDQQDTLQFLGSLKATNDSQNGKTLVDDSPTLVTWDEWNAMTPQQRAAIPKAQITNVPGADGTINAELFKELWVNPNPTASFAAQTITLSSDDYDFLLWEFVNSSPSGSRYLSVICEKGNGVLLQYSAISTNCCVGIRVADQTTNTSYSITDCNWSVNNASKVTDNTRCVPIRVYGFKKTLSLKFSAIAAELSTRADHCLLDDGVTTVEDALQQLTIKTYSNVSVGTTIKLFNYNVGYGDIDVTNDVALYGNIVSIDGFDNAAVPCICCKLGNDTSVRIVSMSNYNASRTAIVHITYSKRVESV